MNKYKKGSFVIILILLIVILPLTIGAIYFHIEYSKGENPKKQFHYKNSLYFYDKSGDLVGTYECNYKNCGYAKQKIDENEYGIKHFINYGFYEDGLIANQYAFIADYKNKQDSVKLYDVKNKEVVATYNSYKNYGIGIVNDYFIVESKQGSYGVIQVNGKGHTNIIPFTYEYIALPNDVDLTAKKLSSDAFIVKKDNKWYLIDDKEAEFTSGIVSPIVAFNSNSLIAKSQNYALNDFGGTNNDFNVKGDTYSIYNYNGTVKLVGDYKYLNYVSNFLEVRDTNNNYYIINLDTLTTVTKLYAVRDETEFSPRINEETNQLEVIIDGELKETVVIS